MSVITVCLWRRCFGKPISAHGFGLASNHISNVLLSTKRGRVVLAQSKFQLRPSVLNGKSSQLETPGNRESPLPRHEGKRANLSSELLKLTKDDGHMAASTTREWTAKQKSSFTAEEHRFEYVFGIHPCLLAVMHGKRTIYGLFIKEGNTSLRASVLEVCKEAHKRGVPIHRVGKKDIDKMAPGHVHQGVCLKASPLTYATEEKQRRIHPGDDENIPPLWLVLERVQDPMNLGAILRSAYFLGVDTVASSVSNSCPLSPVVSKASSGTMEVMDIYGYENLGEMLKVKKELGWDVVGTVGSESGNSQVIKCSDFAVTNPTLLLIGGEGGGLSPKLQAHCQVLLTIPAGRQLFRGIESLNVSVATGILLHSLILSRSKPTTVLKKRKKRRSLCTSIA